MPDIAAVIQQGFSNPWLLVPTALMLGALHALEPGHSKSMMAAFIIAINGTVRQAALLGIAATAGHTIVVWVLALLAWRLADTGLLERAEPWLMLIGGLLLIALAWRILARAAPWAGLGRHHGHDHHGHAHGSDHAHHDGHNHSRDGPHAHDHVEATAHAAHPAFASDDEHAAYHAAEVRKRSTGAPVTNAEVLWFGFTGGLLPCPSAFAVLLACLKTKAYGLGVVMVAAFSVGLALMLVAIGAAAAIGASALQKRSQTFDRWAARAPIVSAVIVLLIGLVSVWTGLRALS